MRNVVTELYNTELHGGSCIARVATTTLAVQSLPNLEVERQVMNVRNRIKWLDIAMNTLKLVREIILLIILLFGN